MSQEPVTVACLCSHCGAVFDAQAPETTCPPGTRAMVVCAKCGERLGLREAVRGRAQQDKRNAKRAAEELRRDTTIRLRVLRERAEETRRERRGSGAQGSALTQSTPNTQRSQRAKAKSSEWTFAGLAVAIGKVLIAAGIAAPSLLLVAFALDLAANGYITMSGAPERTFGLALLWGAVLAAVGTLFGVTGRGAQTCEAILRNLETQRSTRPADASTTPAHHLGSADARPPDSDGAPPTTPASEITSESS